MKKLKFGLLIIMVCVGNGCRKDIISIDTSNTKPLIGLTYVADYFPLKEGAFWTYSHTYKDKFGTVNLGTATWVVLKDSVKIGAFNSAFRLYFLPDSNMLSPEKVIYYFEPNENDGLLRVLDTVYKFGYPIMDLSKLSKSGQYAITSAGVPATKGYFYNMYNPVSNFTSKYGSIETIKSSIDSLGKDNTTNEYNFKKTFYHFSKGIGPVRIEEIRVNKKLFATKPDTSLHTWDLIRYKK